MRQSSTDGEWRKGRNCFDRRTPLRHPPTASPASPSTDPAQRNALTWAMYDALVDAHSSAHRAPMPRHPRPRHHRRRRAKPSPPAPTSANSATFQVPRRRHRLRTAHRRACSTSLEACRVPTIAAIEGACTGGGAAIAACCDLRIAAAGRPIRFPHRQNPRQLPLDGQPRPPLRPASAPLASRK